MEPLDQNDYLVHELETLAKLIPEFLEINWSDWVEMKIKGSLDIE